MGNDRNSARDRNLQIWQVAAAASLLALAASSARATLVMPQLADPALQHCIEALAAEHGWEQIADVTDIQCHGEGISTVVGVDQFTALRKLSLYNNKIDRLDGIQWQALAQLQQLNLARNAFDELTLSNLPKLESLYVFGGELTTLRLSALPRLQVLKANNNELEQFSYQALADLSKIYIFDNQLKTVDIHHLPALSYMDCRENPMPDELYDEMDQMQDRTFLHDGNAEDW